MQSTEILALALPDGCADEVSKTGFGGEDDCTTGCARCLCCARRPRLEPTPAVAAAAPIDRDMRAPDAAIRLTAPSARDVFHVPK